MQGGRSETKKTQNEHHIDTPGRLKDHLASLVMKRISSASAPARLHPLPVGGGERGALRAAKKLYRALQSQKDKTIENRFADKWLSAATQGEMSIRAVHLSGQNAAIGSISGKRSWRFNTTRRGSTISHPPYPASLVSF